MSNPFIPSGFASVRYNKQALARVAKSVDARDLKSLGPVPCRFESGPGHQTNQQITPQSKEMPAPDNAQSYGFGTVRSGRTRWPPSPRPLQPPGRPSSARRAGQLSKRLSTPNAVQKTGATHGERFIVLLQRHYPTWREARAELNELPLAPYR